jgi:hypothetical protein
VVAIDARRAPNGTAFEVFSHGGRIPTGLDAVSWAEEVVALGAGLEQLARVVGRPHTAADRERDRKALRHALDELDESTPAVERCAHVEEDELVGAFVGIARAELDGIADVAQALEANAFDDATVGDVEARDQARERHTDSRYAAPAAPLFSGWN